MLRMPQPLMSDDLPGLREMNVTASTAANGKRRVPAANFDSDVQGDTYTIASLPPG
jgi:hypothetical protein